MDPSLRLLLKLRFQGTVRRWKKAMSRPKGIVLFVVTLFLFLPGFLLAGFSSWMGIKPPMEPIRRFGPLGLFLFTFTALMFSAGEQALYYTPAEITFLFTGPYSKRQLLAYKLFVTVLLCLFSSVFFMFGGAMWSPSLLSTLVGSFLVLMFLQILQIVLGLAAGTIQALTFNRKRLVLVAGLFLAIGLALASVGRDLVSDGVIKILERVEASWVATVILAPFRWFVFTMTADGLTELARWGWRCLAIDAGLVGLVFALDASYMEAASNASAKRFARMQRMIGGGGGLRVASRKTGRFRFRPPNAPWWGGVGPNLWRQMTTALGDPARLFGLMFLLVLLPIFFYFIGRQEPKAASVLLYMSEGMVIWMSIAVSGLLPYDFRGDVDIIEELKTLPISASRMALGQVLTPVLVATMGQSLAIASAIVMVAPDDLAAWLVLAFLFPANFLFFAVENLLFLWYPSRIVAGQFDILAVGRQILMLVAKVICLGLGAGLASVVALVLYFILGRTLAVPLVAAWAVLFSSALALIPMVGRAFLKFDVARDIPA